MQRDGAPYGRGVALDVKRRCLMPEYGQPEPGVVEITGEQEIAPDLVVVPNRHLDLVPNIGVIAGTDSVLVEETGMGPRNAGKVLKFAVGNARARRLYLIT